MRQEPADREVFHRQALPGEKLGERRALSEESDMATDERRDRENENKGTKRDENVKDLSGKKLDEEKEGKVKGGGGEFRPISDDELM